jgi:hypothetical protein
MISMRWRSLFLGVAVALTGGCSGGTLPALPQGSSPIETGSAAPLPAEPSAIEVTRTVSGTPTEVYSLVARGALACWFGGDGPLRTTHIFNAEATPPSQGGAAEITVHERDTARDPRGVRAFRITFTGVAGGVRVAIVNHKFPASVSAAMVSDVSAWAGGGKSCELRKLNPPAPPAPAASPASTGAASRPRR